MGCDIHATIEYDWNKTLTNKTEKAPWWNCFARDVDINRSYTLFALLADVRNSGGIKPISEPRGVPEDASYQFKEEVEEWDGDGHSHSWATFKEVQHWEPTGNEDYDWDLRGYREDDWYRVMEILANRYGDESIRLCFFFDN